MDHTRYCGSADVGVVVRQLTGWLLGLAVAALGLHWCWLSSSSLVIWLAGVRALVGPFVVCTRQWWRWGYVVLAVMVVVVIVHRWTGWCSHSC